MKRDAPDEETSDVLEAANAAAKRVASKWDIGGGGEDDPARHHASTLGDRQ